MSLELFVLWRICQEVVADPVGESKARQSPSAALPESCGSVSQEQHRDVPTATKRGHRPCSLSDGEQVKNYTETANQFSVKK